jgi:hypothetical protein
VPSRMTMQCTSRAMGSHPNCPAAFLLRDPAGQTRL